MGAWASELDGADGIINLVGEPVSQRWTADVRRKIVASRVESTKVLGEACSRCHAPPHVWVNASAVGFYGDTGSRTVDELAPHGPSDDFLVETCQQWEAAARTTVPAPTTLRFVRIGFVLGKGGGAYPALQRLTKLFLGGHVGSGTNYVSWIHLDDLVRQFEFALGPSAPPIMNGTAPTPVTMSELMYAMRHAANRPWSPPAPVFALALASRLLGTPDPGLVTISQRISPKAALDAGFEFNFADLAKALDNLHTSP